MKSAFCDVIEGTSTCLHASGPIQQDAKNVQQAVNTGLNKLLSDNLQCFVFLIVIN